KTIRSYLKERRFHAMVNGTESSERSMLSGVPQGQALGPVLFTIYVMDIPKPEDQRVLNAIYADDTAILATSRNAELAVKLAQVLLMTSDSRSTPERRKRLRSPGNNRVRFPRSKSERRRSIGTARSSISESS
ncbi:hypothetical protein AMK59_1945, partial [Oryctes borbonicus]